MSEKSPRREGATAPILEVESLSVEFAGQGRESSRVVDDVSFAIMPGQHVGLVGESGSGKSVTSLAIMGLLPSRGTTIGGSIRFQGEDLLPMSPRQRNRLAGRDIAMVFQDPMTSLNPVVTIGVQITEVIRRHAKASRAQARERAADLLAKVGIPDPRRRLREYPHQLSGGLRQRVLIAIALACEPKLLIADEPTTALDVTIQAQVLEVLAELVAETGAALLMITHDLGVVAGLCDQVNVIYSGRIVEKAPRDALFAEPSHPYTGGLLESVPRLEAPRGVPLRPIPGSPTQVLPWETGCAFAPRCGRRTDRCVTEPPELTGQAGREVRCFHPLRTAATVPGPVEGER
ncbi:MAG: ABC transporter ATP-binding protein [Nocardioides sp.]|uniref:ABC transporter ATP-binding protein n=1 Tax=Nocardioides sp. TaxID=35761 RepID=UPI0039E2B573